MIVDEHARQQQAREIELELIRVRATAEAARLEARAAELELMLRRMARGEEGTLSAIATQIAAATATDSEKASSLAYSNEPFSPVMHHVHSGASFRSSPENGTQDSSRSHGSELWAGRLQRLHTRDITPAVPLPNIPPASTNSSYLTNDASSTPAIGFSQTPNSQPPLWKPSIHASLPLAAPQSQGDTTFPTRMRFDAGHGENAGVHFTAIESSDTINREIITSPSRADAPEPVTDTESSEIDASLFDTIVPYVIDSDASPAANARTLSNEVVERSDAASSSPTAPSSPTRAPESLTTPKITIPNLAKKPLPVALPAVQLNAEGDQDESPGRRLRPASWFVSTVAHCGILVLLGYMTLTTTQPKDQMAFTASASESTEQSMETFEIESSEPMEPSEPTVSETAYEISDMGTFAVTEVSMDIPPAPAALDTAELMSTSTSSLSSSSMKSLKGETMATSQFCGVDGGGSHFVYLVDSSGSMGDGFQSARNELLNSIDQLKPDQRFYVVFFDEEPDYMRLMDPNVNDTASVMATPQNKQRLRKWAMTVEMNKGKAPYQILPFALSLRPDVIFLLSDGEFPSAIEEILREQNRQENLFGESGPISIVHTIRYHGREGQEGQNAEATMVKIAKENGGQYRHVPKPKANKSK
jgi:hypothetical protein